MSKTKEKILLFLIDFITINLSFFVWYRLRWSMGFFAEISLSNITQLSLIIFVFWWLLFLFFGLHRIVYTQSRIDEFIAVFKTVSIGLFFIFLLTFDVEEDLSNPLRASRLFILSYWAVMIFFVSLGRVLLRSVHRKLLEVGIGRRRTVIVGWGKKSKELYKLVSEAPALGYDIVGFITTDKESRMQQYLSVSVLGALADLSQIINSQSIQEVLIALPKRSEKQLQEVIAQCEGTGVGMKIMPELYDVIIGQVRTNQIYGFPLLDILPQLMAPWERVVKRIVDILFSLIILLIFLPFGLFLAILIKIDSKGPVFYTQERVGRNGKTFKIIKYRTMVQNAEQLSGPVWAAENDPRITRLGRWMRKMRFDEVPQMINVLDGSMSLVGPRPERPYFVEKLKEEIPLYARRLVIRPGITGWAQVKGEYDQSIEHVKQKLEFDLFYIENMSLRMDLKILFHTLHVVLRGKGQ